MHLLHALTKICDFFLVKMAVFKGSENVLSSGLARSEHQGEDDSVIVFTGVQPIRQAD